MKDNDFIDTLTQEIQESEQKSPEQIKLEVETLQASGGWLHLQDVFDKKSQMLAEEILDTDVQGEELNRLRDRRDLCLYFKNLPEIIIETLGQVEEPGIPDKDPYEAAQLNEDQE